MKLQLHILPNGLFNNVQYYSNCNSDYIKVGEFENTSFLPFSTKSFQLSCRHFSSIVQKQGLINGQVIDAYTITHLKDWDKGIMYMPTDDTITAVGDYSEKRRITSLSLYKTQNELQNIILMPYLQHFHWRLLIVNIKTERLALLDPFPETIDCSRVLEEFINFLQLCHITSSFAKLKTKKWVIDVYKGIRPVQNENDGWSCGVLIMYYIKCIGLKKPMDTSFNPNEYRTHVANQLLSSAKSNTIKCIYCILYVENESTDENINRSNCKKKNIVCTNHITCKLCTLYKETVNNQSEIKK